MGTNEYTKQPITITCSVSIGFASVRRATKGLSVGLLVCAIRYLLINQTFRLFQPNGIGV